VGDLEIREGKVTSSLDQERSNSEHGEVEGLLRASIIIVSYNAKQRLLACLTSITKRMTPACEIIVVDNASSEGNADTVEACFPNATLIRSESNLGFAAGCNLGAENSHGKFLVFINPDTLVEEGWLEALVAPLDSEDQIGLTTSRILLLDQPDRINACGCNVHLAGLILCRGTGRSKETYPQSEEVAAISGACFAIRRDLFRVLGGFDEDMFLYGEDTDLSWRARLAGWSTRYMPDSVVFHDYRLRISELRVFWNERNRYLMLLKSLRWRTLLLLVPAYVTAEVITWGFVLLTDRGNIGNKVRAYRWIVENWDRVIEKRRETQALRVITDRELLRSASFAVDFRQAAARPVADIAALVFNSVFFVLKGVTLALVWW
jgi:GT2 family glycosyltransferase